MVNKLQEVLAKLKTHYFIDKKQSQYFFEIRKNIPSDLVIIQIDFSEKFAVKFQDEAQSAYYNQRQILIFTCCAWSAQKTRCMTVLSNFVKQNKFSVARCLAVIVENLKKNIPCIKHLLVFSVGAGSQFKNKFTLSNLVYAEEDYNLKVSWAFSATTHGKGAIDGIGTTLKRFHRNAIKIRKIIIKGKSSPA